MRKHLSSSRCRPSFSLLASVLGAILATGCSRDEGQIFQGYIEGEYLYLAAPQAGYLKSLDSLRGSRVKEGQAIFAVAADPDDQALREAEEKAGAAREKLKNLKEPRRPSEIAALQANLRGAEAALRLASIQLEQQRSLASRHFVAQAKVDETRSVHDQAQAQVEAARQQITTYQINIGRQPEVLGASADYAAATAQAAQKRWIVERKSVTSPALGEIAEIYYRPGEWVPAGSPVASLLPDSRRRVRFFVPETTLASLKPGDVITASCDACTKPIRATIDFISPQAEYTPPVIYSRGSREKLVFRVEATPAPEEARLLRPGLPVDVRISH